MIFCEYEVLFIFTIEYYNFRKRMSTDLIK